MSRCWKKRCHVFVQVVSSRATMDRFNSYCSTGPGNWRHLVFSSWHAMATLMPSQSCQFAVPCVATTKKPPKDKSEATMKRKKSRHTYSNPMNQWFSYSNNIKPWQFIQNSPPMILCIWEWAPFLLDTLVPGSPSTAACWFSTALRTGHLEYRSCMVLSLVTLHPQNRRKATTVIITVPSNPYKGITELL